MAQPRNSDDIFLDAIYDVLAQNTVEQADRDYITDQIDHVDYDDKEIVFKSEGGSEFVLKLEARK